MDCKRTLNIIFKHVDCMENTQLIIRYNSIFRMAQMLIYLNVYEIHFFVVSQQTLTIYSLKKILAKSVKMWKKVAKNNSPHRTFISLVHFCVTTSGASMNRCIYETLKLFVKRNITTIEWQLCIYSLALTGIDAIFTSVQFKLMQISKRK